MWVLDDKLVQSSFAFPHGQSPKLSLEYTRLQRVAEKGWSTTQLALDAPSVEKERAQIAKALQREFGQKDQVFPSRVWLAKGYPGLRRHCASSIDMASVGLATLGMRRTRLRLSSMSVYLLGSLTL